MFGFIKMIQQFIAKLHSNKRVWFTTIFFTATIGVILATYLLISTTNRVSSKVFAQQTKEYELRLKSLERLIQKKLAQLSIAFLQNEKLLNAIEANDQETLLQISNQYSSSITEDEQNSLSIKFYATQNRSEILRNSIIASIQTKNDIFGVEVVQDGVFYIYLKPIIKEEQVIGVIEVRQSIYALNGSFETINQEHVFLLDSKMLPLLALQVREGVYLPVGKNYLVNNKIYNSTTLGYISDVDYASLQKIASGDYILTKDYYLNGVVVRDTNGADIGLIVMGQNINQDGGFIDMAKNMTNQVVMIALGLIVSLLLFLF